MSQYLQPNGSEGAAVRRSKRLSISEDVPMKDPTEQQVTRVPANPSSRSALQNITNNKVGSGGARSKGVKKSRKQSSGDMEGESAAKRAQTRLRCRIGSDSGTDANMDPSLYNPFDHEAQEQISSHSATQDLPPMEDEPLSFEYPPMTQPGPTGTACLTMQVGKMNDSPASFSKEQQLLLQQKQRQQEQLRQQALLQQQQNQLALQQKQQQLLQQHQQQQERARKEAQAKQARPSVTAPIAQGVHQMAITVKQQVTKPSNVIAAPRNAITSGKPRWNNNLYIESDPALLYADEIYSHLRNNEIKYRPKENYMATVQTDINMTMRSILVDWLVEVAEEYKLSSQTLFLTVHYIDRTLSVLPVTRSKLQLLGITAMLVAAKYEEIYPPSIEDFVYISDMTYNRDQVIKMEKELLSTLKFCLSCATTWEFARRFIHAGKLPKKAEALTNFICEFFLQDPNYIRYPPSMIAASAIFLAGFNSGLRPWTDELEKCSGYGVVELTACVNELQACWWRIRSENHNLRAVRDKFKDEKWLRVSDIVPARLVQ